MVSYQGVFEWALVDATPETRMAAAAVVARMLHLMTVGLRHSECLQESADDEILVDGAI